MFAGRAKCRTAILSGQNTCGKGICKVVPLLNYAQSHEDAWRNGGIAPQFLTSASDEDEWSASRPDSFIPGQRIGGWVDSKADLEQRKICCLCRESNHDRPSLARSYPGSLTGASIYLLFLGDRVVRKFEKNWLKGRIDLILATVVHPPSLHVSAL
jgi:hypothetical protein